jgi:TolB protein
VSPGYYDQWPQWSRDGSTIYYSKISNGSAIWHVTPTGTSDDSVANQNPSFDIFPSPSPDGTELAYIADFSSTSDLRILTLATGAVADLQVEAWAPVWSPTGQQIAYLNQTNYSAPIAIVNADGTGQRVLTTQAYQQNFDWSPDGQYIVAQNTAGGEFDLINVATGETLPLEFTSSSYYSPTWQPTAGASPQRAPTATPRAKTIFGRRVR